MPVALSASQAISEIPARIVPAKFILPEAPRQLRKSSHAATVRAAKQQTSPTLHASNAVEAALPARDLTETNVRLTNSDFAPVFTETLFVVIEGAENGGPDQPMFQIQLWRVVVFHPALDPDSDRIPAKQT